MSQNTSKQPPQSGQDTNNPSLPSPENREKKLRAQRTEGIRALLDSEDKSDTNNEDEYVQSPQEVENEIVRGLFGALSEAKRSGIDESEIKCKSEMMIKSMLVHLPDKEDIIVRGMIRAQSLIFPIPKIPPTVPRPISPTITRPDTSLADVSARRPLAINVPRPEPDTKSAPPKVNKISTGSNINHTKNKKVSTDINKSSENTKYDTNPNKQKQ